MERKKRIAIDMDEVIADTMEKYIQVYRQEHDFQLTAAMLKGREVFDALPDDLRTTVKDHLNRPGFFRDIPVMKDSQAVVKELTNVYDVYIVSAAMEFKHSLLDKYEWLQEYFGFIHWKNIVFCGNKIVDVDIMIDDRMRNLKAIEGRKLLFTAHHNIDLQTDLERVDNWMQVADKLL